MNFRQPVVALMILATIHFPCVVHAAEEDRDLAMIAAEQQRDDERLDKINPALTDSLSIKPAQETDKEIKERKKKLKQMRKEKEKDNERKLKESKNRREPQPQQDTVIIEPEPQSVTEPTPPETPQEPITSTPPTQPVTESPPVNQPQKPTTTKSSPPPTQSSPPPTSSLLSTGPLNLPSQKEIYANFVEVANLVHFVPLYMPRKSGYEITEIYAGQGIVELRYGRRWEPTVSLAVRTYKRADGEEPQDISGVTGVKWRIDNTTGITVYIAKISDTQHVAAWAVGHYTFSAQGENLSFAAFHTLVADELVELSTHYYIDL